MKKLLEIDEHDLIYVPIEIVTHSWKAFWIYTLRSFIDGTFTGMKIVFLICFWEGLKWYINFHSHGSFLTK